MLQNELNTSLNNSANWLKANKLTLNVSKSNIILFGRNGTQINILDIQAEGQKIQHKDYAKYLDIFINVQFAWKKYIEIINCKVSKETGMLLGDFPQENN